MSKSWSEKTALQSAFKIRLSFVQIKSSMEEQLFACIAIIQVHFCSILNFPRSFWSYICFPKIDNILLENKQWWDFFSSHFSARKCKLWPSPYYFETFNQVFPPTSIFELIWSKQLILYWRFVVLAETFTHTFLKKYSYTVKLGYNKNMGIANLFCNIPKGRLTTQILTFITKSLLERTLIDSIAFGL